MRVCKSNGALCFRPQPWKALSRARGWAKFRAMLRASAQALAGLVLAASLLAVTAAAAEGVELPRFASFAAAKVYLREGPSYRNRILWIYHRRGLPVEVLAEYDVWRRIRLPDGAVGWVHTAMLSDRRTVVVTGSANAPIRGEAAPASRTLALAQPGVIAKLDSCEATACEISVDGTDGWIEKKNVWGVRPGESVR